MFGIKEAENYMSKMRSAARCHLNNPDSIYYGKKWSFEISKRMWCSIT